MAEQRMEIKKDDRGLLSVAASSAANLGEKAVTASFGMLRDARGEISQRTVGLIDWVDGAQQGSMRLLRTLNQRVDEVVNAFIDSGERVGLAVVRTVDTTGNGAAELMSRTASSLTSTRGADRVASA